MSERPIQVGDLVQVVGTVCCDIALGTVFRVGDIEPSGARFQCVACGTLCPDEPLAIEGWGHDKSSGLLSCLKRIPPLDELESTKDTERLKETA